MLNRGFMLSTAVVAMLAGSMGGASFTDRGMLRPDRPDVRTVRSVIGGKGQKRRQRKRAYLKHPRALDQGRPRSPKPWDDFQSLVQKMTNHERNLWARAGYPGLRKRDTDELLPHAGAAHRRLTNTFQILGENFNRDKKTGLRVE